VRRLVVGSLRGVIAFVGAALLLRTSYFLGMALIFSAALLVQSPLLFETMLLWRCPAIWLRTAAEWR
jgi:hypothetical protein